MIEYAYNNNYYVFIKVSSFFLMYNYNSKIHYEIKNNFAEKKVLSVKDRVQRL